MTRITTMPWWHDVRAALALIAAGVIGAGIALLYVSPAMQAVLMDVFAFCR